MILIISSFLKVKKPKNLPKNLLGYPNYNGYPNYQLGLLESEKVHLWTEAMQNWTGWFTANLAV